LLNGLLSTFVPRSQWNTTAALSNSTAEALIVFMAFSLPVREYGQMHFERRKRKKGIKSTSKQNRDS
jgi:hypothetical protein